MEENKAAQREGGKEGTQEQTKAGLKVKEIPVSWDAASLAHSPLTMRQGWGPWLWGEGGLAPRQQD